MNWSSVNTYTFIPAMITLGIIILLHVFGMRKSETLGKVAAYVNLPLHLLLITLLAFSHVTIEFLALCIMSSVLTYSAASYFDYRKKKRDAITTEDEK